MTCAIWGSVASGAGLGMERSSEERGGGSAVARRDAERQGGRRRPGARRSSTEGARPPLLTQPRAGTHGAGYELLDAHAFRNAICAYLAEGRDQEFTLVVLKPDSPTTTVRLGELVLNTVRASSGDLAGKLEGALAVLLRTSRPPEVIPFVERVNVAWHRLGGPPLTVEIAGHPAEELRIADLLSADWLDN